MASTPPSLYVSPSEAPAAVSQSSRSRYQVTPSTSKNSPGSSNVHLKLNKILGFTTSSASGFDYSPLASCFAICAGSAAAVAHVDDGLNLTWKYFRTRLTVFPIVKALSPYETETPTTPNTPEHRSRKAATRGTWRGGRNAIRSTGSPLAENGPSPGSNIVRQRIRAVTCVSLTADGKLLAVGETGYHPRILIFSTTAEDTDVPLTSLSEHAFGVRCLAFSPDMRWLCSIGDYHDGFIYIWAITSNAGAKLQYSNKCTSFVHHISWMGDSVVSVGTRHARIWRLDQIPLPSPSKPKSRLESLGSGTHSTPAARMLSGRNCLLGSLIEATFTCIATVSNHRVILCTEGGDVCVLDDNEHGSHLYTTWRLGFPITCSAIDHGSGILWIGGKGGNTQAILLDRLTGSVDPVGPESAQSSRSRMGLADLVAIALLPQGLITFDSNHTTRIESYATLASRVSLEDSVKVMPSHPRAVLGVGVLYDNDTVPELFSWSGNTVYFWSGDGVYRKALDIPLGQPLCSDGGTNEVKVVMATQDGQFFLSGDRSGTLRLLEGLVWEDSVPVNAHDGEINDIALASHKGSRLVATCGRDRTVQIFRILCFRLDLLQTIDQHSSAVNAILFLHDGVSLLSSSSDRTIIIHTLAAAVNPMAYIPMRVITLKSSPTSMSIAPESSNTLRVSAMDRQLHQYDIASGRHIHSMKLVDHENNESVLLSNFLSLDIEGPRGLTRLMIGVSSDKSIRVYNRDTGFLESKEYGHSEGISGIKVFKYFVKEDHPEYRLVSTGMDGTVTLWDLTLESTEPLSTTDPHQAQMHDQPLRRILSRVTLSDLQRSQNSSAKPLSPTTPIGGQSPLRSVREKPSRCALASSAPKTLDPAPIPMADASIRRRRRPERSATPPSPPTGWRLSLGERPRTKSPGILTESHVSTEHVSKVLRAYRKKLSASRETLKQEKTLELECELNLTLRAISQTIGRHQAPSDTTVGDLLDQYSDKLASLVEEKINTGIANKVQAGTLSTEHATGENVAGQSDERG